MKWQAVQMPDRHEASLSPPSGWQAAHVGFDHDNVIIDGLPVWSMTWREESTEPVMLAHPAYPAQLHKFRIYNVDDGTCATRFAAAELSNTVWGFYRWVVAADAASGNSADGSLRYEHDLGPFENWRYDAVAPVARLYDVQTQTLLFDGVAWGSSRVVPQADGAMLLSLERRQRQTIFRIDPEKRVFCDLTVPSKVRVLTELDVAAAAARAECDLPANAYIGRHVAPDGSLLVDLAAVEWSNTHWVNSPRVIEIATRRVLLDLWDTDWDASVSFVRARTVRLGLRRYHFGGSAEAEIDLANDHYIVIEGPRTTTGPIEQLPIALEEASRTSATLAGSRPLLTSAPLNARSWLIVLLILLGAIGMIAAATLTTLYFQHRPTVLKLDSVSPMPRVDRAERRFRRALVAMLAIPRAEFGRPLGSGSAR